MSMTREQAWDLLTQYNQEEFHLSPGRGMIKGKEKRRRFP